MRELHFLVLFVHISSVCVSVFYVCHVSNTIDYVCLNVDGNILANPDRMGLVGLLWDNVGTFNLFVATMDPLWFQR